MHLLLVEDSRPIRLENERALKKAGYEVTCAQDGENALELARTALPDMILLDLLLPRMDGVHVLRELKKDQSTWNIPVVVISGLSGKNQDRLLAEGAEEFLEKNTIMAENHHNQLPSLLQDIICRINRRRGNNNLVVPLAR